MRYIEPIRDWNGIMGIDLIPNFLTSLRCQHIINISESLKRSQNDRAFDKGAEKYGKYKTKFISNHDELNSDQTILRIQYEIRGRIDEYFKYRIVDPEDLEDYLNHIDEDLEDRITFYSKGSSFSTHLDSSVKETQNRLLSYLIYLNDDFEGGETVFSNSTGDFATVKPEQGTLLMFPSNFMYSHRSEKIIEGRKYVYNGFAPVISF